jgi:hypothetical protein
MHATGTFTVNLAPLPLHAPDPTRARFSIDKQFSGDLAGTSQGEMLTAGTDVKGSAGYVAIERVTATLHGKSGSFALQHSGSMNRGTPSLLITIVPDSGTGDLAGIAGTFSLDIADGLHSYDLEYTLGELK